MQGKYGNVATQIRFREEVCKLIYTSQNMKDDRFDIDTIKDDKGWHCDFYRGNKKLCGTKNESTQEAAEEAIVQAIVALESNKRPADLNSIIWNAISYRDFKGSGILNNGGYSSFSNTATTTYSHCDHDPSDKKNICFQIGKVNVIGATKAKISALDPKWKKKRLIVNCSGTGLESHASLSDSKKITRPFLDVPKHLESVFDQKYAFTLPKPKKIELEYGDEVVVDWPDQGSAPLSPQFWVDLLTFIRSEAFQKQYADVVFCCFGGHGRTGTALASLALVAHIYDENSVTFKDANGKPILDRIATMAEKAEVYVQHDYCKKAVESDAQVAYLEYVEAFLAKKEIN